MLRLCSKNSKTTSNLVFGYFSIVHGNGDGEIEATLVDIFIIVHFFVLRYMVIL